MKTTNNKQQTTKLSLTSLFVFFLFSCNLNAQNYIDNRAWVKVTNSNYESNSGTGGFTNSPTFNIFLESINVTKYQQALPFAKTPDLLQYYEVECNGCDLSSLQSYIETNSILGLSNFYKDFNSEVIDVYEPSDFMWTLHRTDTNFWHYWYFDKIQADLAWDITTGDTNVKVAVLDWELDLTHKDLRSELLLPYDPYTPSLNWDNCFPNESHGTNVASMVSAETAEFGTTANARMVSIGFNTKMYFYEARVGRFVFLQKILHATNVMKVKALVSCGTEGIAYTGSPLDEIVIKEILDNGTSIIAPAGNGLNGTHNPLPNNSVSNPFYPFHPKYDERIIIVSGTGEDDRHYQFANGSERTHSHFPEVDVCAPGFNLMVAMPTLCDTLNPLFHPYYGFGNGTSLAAPLVAGIVSLMYSINPCLTTEEVQTILKTTTDPIVDAAAYPGLVGTGRVNAYKAVKKSRDAKSVTLDLYIKDRHEDVGISGGYDWQATRDNSPDIWVRRQNDGLVNQQHQDPEYSIVNPNYVYVRVRNKSCDTSSAQEVLRLYWSKASSWSSWPQNWDGTQPLIGDVIDTIIIPPLEPGKDTILEFSWNILNPSIHNNWATCLLARIEDNPIDPIAVYPGRIDDDIFFNNNIAMKNITIIDSIIGNVPPPQVNGALFPIGRYMFIGNTDEVEKTFDFKISEYSENQSVASITEEAELKLITDQTGWDILLETVNNTEGIEIYNEENLSFIITNSEVILENVSFPSTTRIPIYVGFNFLIDEVTSEVFYTFKLEQFESSTGKILGGEQFEVTRSPRNPFYADAGFDQHVRVGESITLNATVINEPAVYNWYKKGGVLISSTSSAEVSPEDNATYTLEVISETDGYKDYDEVNVTVQYNWLESISPNPATNMVNIDFSYEFGNRASIMLLNSSATYQQSYTVAISQNNISINVSNFTPGSYSAILIVDGIAVDSKALIIQ